MPVFLGGVMFGALSGVGTYLFTQDGQLSAIIGAVVAILFWLGIAVVVFFDD